MKNKKKIIGNSIIGLLVLSLGISCSKDRIEERTPVNQYDSQNTNNYLDSKKQTEQEYTIDSSGTCPLTGLLGTEICMNKRCLMFPNGDSVWFPYKIKLVELYTPADMIYYQLPTISNDTIMETDGEIRLRAFKNGTELLNRTGGCSQDIWMPNAAPQNYMRVFYGNNGAGNMNWYDNVSGVAGSPVFTTITSPNRYVGHIGQLGWINCGIKRGSNTNHTLNFTSSTDNLTNVALFAYFPATKTVMQVYNTVSGSIPANSNVVIIGIGVDASGQLFSFNQSLTVTSSSAVNITMSATTDANLTAFLNGL